jgi:hypothetical protein
MVVTCCRCAVFTNTLTEDLYVNIVHLYVNAKHDVNISAEMRMLKQSGLIQSS